jgi:hypothetical protein
VVAALGAERGEGGVADADGGRLADAAALLDHLVLDERFEEFLTIPGYERLTDE